MNGVNGANGKKLHMIGNAHIDPVWLWQWQEGYHEVKATFASALQLMKEYDDFIFISSSALFYQWIEESDPLMFAEIHQRVQEGRWNLVGGWWVQPDCNIPCGESFVRQALYAQRYFKEKFGVTARVGYNVDSFGHHGMLPQILKKSGLDYYVFMRPSPHEKGLPARLFWWEAGDGSRVLAFRLPYEYCTWGDDLVGHVDRCAIELKAPLSEGMCFFGVGNHGGGPTRGNLESIRRLQLEYSDSKLEISTPERYFDEMVRQGAPAPVVHDDLQHHASGCYAAHSGVKRWNRQAENLLLTAEKFATIASYQAVQQYPRDLDQAWKDVLFNQFHDILAGTSVEAAYEDARNLYGEAMAIGGRVLNRAVQAIAWRIQIDAAEGTRPLVVFNPHAWSVNAPVELEVLHLKENEVLLDAVGREIPYQQIQSSAAAKGPCRIVFMAELPPLGYSLFRLVQRPGEQTLAAFTTSDTVLENDRFRLEIDPQTGWINDLWDKHNQLPVFTAPAARPVVIDDPTDTWGHNCFSFDRVVGEFSARSVRLVESGPVRATIRVTSEWGASQLVQDFILYQDREGIEVRVTVDWHEQMKMLKLRFPLHLNFMRAVNEIPYGHIEKFASGEEQPGQSWVDVSGISRQSGKLYGLSILNDGKYSFDVNIRDIGLTVLRSPVYANHMPVIPAPDGTYSYLDQGLQRFTYVLLPHTGSWETSGTVRRAAELNAPPVTLPATFHAGDLPVRDSYLSVDAENIVVSVLKQAQDGQDWILRAHETTSAATHARICLPLLNRLIEAQFGPLEIKTFRIPLDPGEPVTETGLLEWELEHEHA